MHGTVRDLAGPNSIRHLAESNPPVGIHACAGMKELASDRDEALDQYFPLRLSIHFNPEKNYFGKYDTARVTYCS